MEIYRGYNYQYLLISRTTGDKCKFVFNEKLCFSRKRVTAFVTWLR